MRSYVPVLLAVLCACGGDTTEPTDPTTGSLQIRTETAGEVTAEGYSYRVDGEPPQAIGTNATISRENLETGSHVIQLAGLPDGCSASGTNPQAVSVEPGSTSTVSFAITCVPPVGTIQVATATSGPAPSGYDLLLDAHPLGHVGASETRALDSVSSGVHSIGLSGVPANCQLAGENPRDITLQTGDTTGVDFAITCVAPPPETGTLRITIATTGMDPDGYRLVVDDIRQPVGLNGTVILSNVAAGNHLVRLAGLATSCAPAEANPRQVAVTAASTAALNFTVTCTPPPVGSLLISTATTGSSPDSNGYTFALDGGAAQQIASSAAVTVDSIEAGAHTLALSGLAEGCTLDGSNPRAVSVTAGSVTEIVFAVACEPPTSSPWTRLETGTSFSLYSIWGSSPEDVFTVGEPGGRFEAGIFHYDGQAWSQQSTESGVTLYGVWGSGGSDVFAVGSSPLGAKGYDGVILHYDGTAWTPMAGPGVGTGSGSVQVELFSVWGASSTDVFAVGEAGSDFNRALIAHYDGTHWSEMPLELGGDRVLRDVSGSSGQDVYAVGFFDASTSLKGKFSLAARARLFSEGVIFHYDGSTWQEAQPAAANLSYNGVWAAAANDVFVVGASNDQGVVLHFDGTAWSTMPAPPTGPLLDVWGTSGADVYAAGVGTILHFDGQSWTEALSASQRLAGVWAGSPSDVFVAGSSGTVLRGSATLTTAARR
ncbi:MAG: WD40/YVTN/BNR-like repeat-containing protein [Gemmatimonadales bacterium]